MRKGPVQHDYVVGHRDGCLLAGKTTRCGPRGSMFLIGMYCATRLLIRLNSVYNSKSTFPDRLIRYTDGARTPHSFLESDSCAAGWENSMTPLK
jgi:hypothetical protein